MKMDIEIHEIVKEDAPPIHALIQGLAEFEKMPEQVEITVDSLGKDIETKAVLGYLAKDGGVVAGMLLFYLPYSTWKGQYVHMEDLYVDPKYRGKGVGRRLWAELAKYAEERNIKRLQWNVLDWNTDAITFYEKMPCTCLTKTEGWLLYRMEPEEISALAKHA